MWFAHRLQNDLIQAKKLRRRQLMKRAVQEVILDSQNARDDDVVLPRLRPHRGYRHLQQLVRPRLRCSLYEQCVGSDGIGATFFGCRAGFRTRRSTRHRFRTAGFCASKRCGFKPLKVIVLRSTSLYPHLRRPQPQPRRRVRLPADSRGPNPLRQSLKQPTRPYNAVPHNRQRQMSRP